MIVMMLLQLTATVLLAVALWALVLGAVDVHWGSLEAQPKAFRYLTFASVYGSAGALIAACCEAWPGGSPGRLVGDLVWVGLFRSLAWFWLRRQGLRLVEDAEDLLREEP